ncbi:Undecaprenyl-phosphate glucose phosphotransferase [Trinickia symbiotica]|uniref:Undecaprenyl-phosphate glucose phosphotransferase n=1 Tax=Trinickia symbiotica TaxID=863227 RepID=A0A2N7X5Y9_9BURK|nr:undecaprenyl-phosphate glucose phosphotransferase [Trinickia symbiotica]PMS37044.1 undecaprenyl-phosphate glucose phosphotransferase [Trinickia symbiotica]PPK43020.1 Undecaprenyl-phosphate glucose phosphotransferase [Trinickia symbiotica]
MAAIPGSLARVLDVVLVLAGAQIASQMRLDALVANPNHAGFVAFAEAGALAMFPVFGVYQSWRGRSLTRLASRVALAWLVVQASGLILMFSLHASGAISRLWFFDWSALTGSAMIASRLAAGAALARVRHAGLNLRSVAVVGGGEHGEQIIRKLESSTGSGFRAVSVFDSRGGGISPAVCAGLAAFNDFTRFAEHVRASDVRELWIALPLSDEAMILDCLNEFRDDLLNIRLFPDVRSLEVFDGGMVDLIGVPAINLVASPLSPGSRMQKDVFDRVFAAFALLALVPLLLVISIAVKLSSPGPILFKQRRKGADGHVFNIFKFRTMRVHTETPGTVRQATRNDSRITKVGAFLRRTSLDELPQFINVLRGEMSVVGPRPHALEHDDFYRRIVNGYIHRYRMKPGITGWAQINGLRGETDRVEKMQRRIEHDLYYLRNWSFALDIRIIAATIVKGFAHPNAY